jgi:hypothetical protein
MKKLFDLLLNIIYLFFQGFYIDYLLKFLHLKEKSGFSINFLFFCNMKEKAFYCT